MNVEMEEKNNKNMELWNKVNKTDPKDTKLANNGKYEFYSICAYSQIKKATEIWGPFGASWGVKDEHFNIIAEKNICLYSAILFFPDGNIFLHSDIRVFFKSGGYNDDWSKKVATDALTKGLSKRGFNSDIFEGKFNDKYLQQMNQNDQNENRQNNNHSNNQNNNSNDENNINQSLLEIRDIADEADKEKINKHLNNNNSINIKKAFLNYLTNKYKNHSS